MENSQHAIDRTGFVRVLVEASIAFAVLTASSHIAVPLWPVPITMQTLAVTLCGVLLGSRFGAAVVTAWVLAGFTGLPLFACGNAGMAAMTGPTAGYLYSFPVIAATAGYLAGNGGAIRTFAAMLAANLLCLVIGTAWLAVSMPVASAFAAGSVPFLPGALLKSILGAAIVHVAGKRCR